MVLENFTQSLLLSRREIWERRALKRNGKTNTGSRPEALRAARRREHRSGPAPTSVDHDDTADLARLASRDDALADAFDAAVLGAT